MFVPSGLNEIEFGLFMLTCMLQSSNAVSGSSVKRMLVYLTADRRAKLLYVRCRSEALYTPPLCMAVLSASTLPRSGMFPPSPF